MFDHDSFVVLFSEVSLESIPVIAHSLAIRTGELEVTIQMGNDHMGLGFLLFKDRVCSISLKSKGELPTKLGEI